MRRALGSLRWLGSGGVAGAEGWFWTGFAAFLTFHFARTMMADLELLRTPPMTTGLRLALRHAAGSCCELPRAWPPSLGVDIWNSPMVPAARDPEKITQTDNLGLADSGGDRGGVLVAR
jgi:hypothetical protein